MAIFETGYAPVTSIAASGTSQVFVAGSVSTGSRDVTLVNQGPATIYVGQSGVTSSTGFPVAVGNQLTLQGAVVNVYAVAGTGGATVEAGLVSQAVID